MHFEEGNLYHIYNQGNNKLNVFHEQEEYIFFLQLIRKNLIPYTDLLAYCLMPNHFHLMINADKRCKNLIKQGGLFIDPITNSFRKTLSCYTHVKNVKSGNSGSLFRQKTKAKSLSEMDMMPGDMLQKMTIIKTAFITSTKTHLKPDWFRN